MGLSLRLKDGDKFTIGPDITIEYRKDHRRGGYTHYIVAPSGLRISRVPLKPPTAKERPAGADAS
jgi:hypothetical protein